MFTLRQGGCPDRQMFAGRYEVQSADDLWYFTAEPGDVQLIASTEWIARKLA